MGILEALAFGGVALTAIGATATVDFIIIGKMLGADIDVHALVPKVSAFVILFAIFFSLRVLMA